MSLGPHIQTEQVEAILTLMGDAGVSLKAACDDAGLSYSSIRKRIRDSAELTALHAQAREDYTHSKVERMQQISEEIEDVARARLMCDNIKWEAARILSKQYGDKLDVAHSGGVTVVMTPTDAAL